MRVLIGGSATVGRVLGFSILGALARLTLADRIAPTLSAAEVRVIGTLVLGCTRLALSRQRDAVFAGLGVVRSLWLEQG